MSGTSTGMNNAHGWVQARKPASTPAAGPIPSRSSCTIGANAAKSSRFPEIATSAQKLRSFSTAISTNGRPRNGSKALSRPMRALCPPASTNPCTGKTDWAEKTLVRPFLPHSLTLRRKRAFLAPGNLTPRSSTSTHRAPSIGCLKLTVQLLLKIAPATQFPGGSWGDGTSHWVHGDYRPATRIPS